jgi:5'-deoxynucleotidase YfbR-like HD superfamily hydrolase
MEIKDKLQFISEGASVERYHTRPGIKPDTDGRHSHGVAMLCILLSGGEPRAELLMAALTHDLGEQLASDVNANTKKFLPGGAEAFDLLERGALARHGFDYWPLLTTEERGVLKAADVMDRLLWCCREISLGNKNSLLVWRKTCRALEAMAQGLTLDAALRASAAYEAVKDIHAEASGPGGPSFDVFA